MVGTYKGEPDMADHEEREDDALQDLESTLLGGPDDNGLLGLRKLEPFERRNLMIALLNLFGDLRQELEKKQG